MGADGYGYPDDRTCSTLGTTQAKEETFASRGNLIYEDGSGSGEGLQWYAEDLLLLKEKLSAIPSQCFDPTCYTHEHCWVYQNRNENTHTKHCDGCGAAFDSTEAHEAVSEERCAISFGGREYPGGNLFVTVAGSGCGKQDIRCRIIRWTQ